MQHLFDAAVYQQMIEEKGSQLFGRRYRIHPVDQPLVHRMIAYFAQDQQKAREERIYLGKGLMLTGPVGCGKSSLMQIFAAMSGGPFAPRVVNARQVAMEFNKSGYEVIARYGDQSFDKETQFPIVYCFDGLGSESTTHHYGQSCNVMEEILISRETGPSQMLTHVITNLDAPTLEKRYGRQVRSRMREMFNLMSFSPDSPDKRI